MNTKPDNLEWVEGPIEYNPTDEDYRHLIHAMLLDHDLKNPDQADYEVAGDISRQARSINPNDENWLRAQIACGRADRLDVTAIFETALGENPHLDRRAVDQGRKPKSYRFLSEFPPGFAFSRSQEMYLSLMALDFARAPFRTK